MSYSIGATKATKAELEIAIRDALSEVPKTQSVHEADIDQAFNAAKSLIDLMQDDPVRDLYCSISGSIWKTDTSIQNVSFNIGVNYQVRK